GAPAAAGPASGGESSARLNDILERAATAILRENPQRATALGVSEERAGGRYIDRLPDSTKAGSRRVREMLASHLRELDQLDRGALSAQDAVTHDVVSTSFRNTIASLNYEVGNGAQEPYAVTQLTGAYTDIPDFLDAQHPLTNREQADAYLARLSGYARMLDEETAIIGEDAGLGVIPPDFAIARGLGQLTALAGTAPADTVLVQSLVRRLPQVAEISEADRNTIIARAEAIVRDEVHPAHQRQIDALRALQPRAVHDAGVWRLPQGSDMYAAALRARTTTTMTPDEIHDTGVELIRQLQSEMDAILRAEGMDRGTIAERVRALSARPDQLYPNTDEGRAQILADLTQWTREIEALMPQVSGVLAQARLEIRRVPPYTEAGAPGGYYQRGALDGSRPGAYYINLRDTSEWPRFTLPTLNYHEGIPGHHWQGSIQQESGGLPFIRSALLGFGAFGEGWGLYAEQLADELGVYAENPLGRLGYLQSMTFRASRLVVDTGMHHKRWSREQAIDSMEEATGDQRSSITTEIERYCVWPGQACSYMVGKLVILRLRDEARQSMGARFSMAGFHDTILTNGSVPLSVLESNIRSWSAA
ncbi:MAG: DUF885 family protein, partial [Hyphomonadaceae bacterium]